MNTNPDYERKRTLIYNNYDKLIRYYFENTLSVPSLISYFVIDADIKIRLGSMSNGAFILYSTNEDDQYNAELHLNNSTLIPLDVYQEMYNENKLFELSLINDCSDVLKVMEIICGNLYNFIEELQKIKLLYQFL